jgi:hypothetical protein
MNNSSYIGNILSSNSSPQNLTLDELLDKLGFEKWKTVTASFILPIVNLIGLVFCSLSLWIFFLNRFKMPIFFYYRLLNVVYILSLLLNIPAGLLYSPRYFNHNQRINSCALAVFNIYYGSIANFLFHYGDVLQMAILLTRMKLFSPTLNSFFTASPKFISIVFFFTCLLIDAPYVFSMQVSSLGKYYFEDSSGTKWFETYYFLINSDFAMSPIGQLIEISTTFTLNILCSLIVGIVLNIVSLVQYKSHVKKKRQHNEAINIRLLKICNDFNISNNINDQLSEKDKNGRDAEKNMLYMVLCLCLISIMSRLIIIFFILFFLFHYSFSGTLTLMVVFITIYTLVPTVSIFIFYSFNKIYREEFDRIFFSQRIFCSKKLVLLPTPFRIPTFSIPFLNDQEREAEIR